MSKPFVILVTFLILTACNDVNTVTPSPETTSITAMPDLIPTTTNTPVAPLNAMSFHCLDIKEHPPLNYSLTGTLVFNNADNTDAYLWNNDTKNEYEFSRNEGDRLLDFDVSPDRKHVAYLRMSNTESWLVIATADGQPVWSQIIDSYYWEWFDNNRLINLAVPQNGAPSLSLLNPFSGVRQELQTDYPDSKVFSGDWFPSWKYTKGGLPLYDPTLTRVVYPECATECQERLLRGEYGWPIAIRDTEKDQVIARIITMDVYGKTPYWTPDGEQFIFATKLDSTAIDPYANEYFAVSRDGEIKQLTHFTDYYEEVDIFDNYSLSPNGKLLAFWIAVKMSPYEGARLAVLNIETSVVTNYCVSANPDELEDPIWSPDGTQLLITSQGKNIENKSRTVLVDLNQDYAAQIAEGVIPVGWMVSP